MKPILALVFFFQSILSFAQVRITQPDSSNKRHTSYGCNISHLTNFDLNYTDGFSFITTAKINKPNYSASIGPVWWIDRNNSVNFFRGGMFTIEYYPNKTDRRVNFYFINDLSYTFEKYSWNRYMKTINYTDYYNVEFKSIWQALQEQIGYGFNVKIYKGLYINQSMTIGFEFHNYKSKTTVAEDPSLSSEYSTGNIFSGSATKGYLKIGIGYNYNSR